MRISRALAMAGVGSRRKCEVHVTNGAVRVNGEIVRDLGRQVDIEQDEIVFRGKVLSFERFVYYVLNKPVGFTTTAEDPHAEKTVYQLLPRNLVRATVQAGPNRIRVFPVGRLDKDSMGLLLFTNDGDLANRLTHPRYGVSKWYDVRLHRAFDPRDAKKLLAGIRLREGWAKAQTVQRLSQRVVRLEIREGKKREIRRMFKSVGYQVNELCRIAFGPLRLENLGPGQGRFLKTSEIAALTSSVSAD